MTSAPDGIECRNRGYVSGLCEAGRCVVTDADMRPHEVCKKVQQPYTKRYINKCRTSIAYILPHDDRTKAERTLEKKIDDLLRYDIVIRLVHLPDGGYNIVQTPLLHIGTRQSLGDPGQSSGTVQGAADFSSQ